MTSRSTNNIRLSDLIEIKHGFAFSSKFFSQRGKYLLLTPGNFNEAGGFRDLGPRNKYYTGSFPDAYILSKGDLLVAMTEQAPGLLGSTIIVPESGKYLHNQRLGLIQIIDSVRICREFLFHLLNSPLLRKLISESASGTKVRHTSPSRICEISIFIPKAVEQSTIATILTTLDTAIEKIEKLIEAKEKRFSWLLNRLINQGRVKGELCRVKLGEVAEIYKGQQLNVADMVDSGKYYALNGGIDPSGFTNSWNTNENTITISEGGNSCGFVNFNTEKFWCGGHCYALNNLNNEIAKKYLYNFLKAYEKSLMRMRVGSGLPNIQKKDLHNFLVTFPPISEQNKIAETLDTAQQEIALLKKQAEAYRRQKRGLMQKLLTGQWRVKTPEVKT